MSILNEIGVQGLVHAENFNISKAMFDLRTSPVNKPMYAIWTSDWNDDRDKIAWIEWCMYNGYVNNGHKNLYKIIPKKNLKIYEIDTVHDYNNPALYRDRNLCINYRKMAEEGYDAIRFTENAAILGHLLGYRIINEIGFNTQLLYFMDCESTCWLNTNWIESIEKTDYILRV